MTFWGESKWPQKDICCHISHTGPWTLRFVFWTVSWTALVYLVPFTANGTKMHQGAFQRHSAHTVHSGAMASAGEKWRGAIISPHAVLFLPCVLWSLLTPFCTQCYAVEHENKNTLPQVYQVSRHELVSGAAPKTSVLSPDSSSVLIYFYFSAHYCLPICRSEQNRFILYNNITTKEEILTCKHGSTFYRPKQQKYSILKLS